MTLRRSRWVLIALPILVVAWATWAGGEFDRWNIAGIKSVLQLRADVRDLVVNGPEPDPPGQREEGRRPTEFREPPPAPVMGD